MGGTWILGMDAMAEVIRSKGADAVMDELIARLRRSIEKVEDEPVDTFDRTGFHYEKPALGLIEWMPAMELGRIVSIKTVGYHPSNPVERGEPSVLATTSLYDTTTGRLAALCEATFLTALRTGAASAVVTEVLGADDATTIGVVGCGAQSVTQVHAISRVRPIERVIAFDTQPEVAATLEKRLPDLPGLTVQIVDGSALSSLVAESDVICTATTVGIGDPPVLPYYQHKDWLHINAVGADFAGKLELHPAYLEHALVCPDVVEQCLIEGECQRLSRGQLGPDMAELLQRRHAYGEHKGSLSVFDSTGWALQDLVAAELMLEFAMEVGVGVEVDLQPRPTDPYDPYEFVK